MDAPSTLSLSLLRLVLNRLLDDVEERSGGDEVEVTVDSYWVLDPADMFDPHKSPLASSLTLGQLSDDVAEVRSAAATTDPPVVWHDLAHAIGVLHWLAARDRP